MARHGNMKEQEEAAWGDEDDEFEQETEYKIDQVLNALPHLKLKRDRVYDALVEADFYVDEVIRQFEEGEKKKSEKKKPAIWVPEGRASQHRKSIDVESDLKGTEHGTKLAMKRKLSKEEVTELQVEKRNWNDTYPDLKGSE